MYVLFRNELLFRSDTERDDNTSCFKGRPYRILPRTYKRWKNRNKQTVYLFWYLCYLGIGCNLSETRRGIKRPVFIKGPLYLYFSEYSGDRNRNRQTVYCFLLYDIIYKLVVNHERDENAS